MFAAEQFATSLQPRVLSQGIPRWGARVLALIAAERHVPRYFFHVYDGVSVPDKEGTELPDTQTAQREAIHLAGRIIAEDAERVKLGEDWRLEVTDQRGAILFRLDFRVTDFAEASKADEAGDAVAVCLDRLYPLHASPKRAVPNED